MSFPWGDALSVTTSAPAGPAAGSYSAGISSIAASTGYMDDFRVYLPGNYVVINPIPLTIRTGSKDKAYDGTPLTCSDSEVLGLAPGDSITVNCTGRITDAGSTDNSCSIEWGSVPALSYDITYDIGKLTVSKQSVAFDLHGGRFNFDGWPVVIPTITGAYGNGSAVSGSCVNTYEYTGAPATGLKGTFDLYGGTTVTLTVGSYTSTGTYTVNPSVSWSGNPNNFSVSYKNATVVVEKNSYGSNEPITSGD